MTVQKQLANNLKLTMLIVDDEEAILNSLRFLFRKDYHVTTAKSGEEASKIIDQQALHPDIVLCDERMAGMKGHEFLERMHNRDPETICILATGYADMASLVSAVNTGHIYNYIEKPWVNSDLKAVVTRAAEYHNVRMENITLNQSLTLANSELERHVEERTVELKRRNEQLRDEIEGRKIIAEELNKARAQAEDDMHSKARFLSNMNYEIRTPMNGVIGLTELLQTTPEPEMQKTYIDRLQLCGHRLLTVINNILDFSYMDTGSIHYETVPFELRKIFKYALDNITFEAERNNNTLSLEVDKDIPEIICGDINHIQHVLINLINNSNKYTHNGEIKISAEKLSLDDEHIHLKISVIDNGSGIPGDKLNTLFQEREKPSDQSRKYVGNSGTGLHVCRQLVEGMGGKISAHSNPGIKTTLSFILTLKLFTKKNFVNHSIQSYNNCNGSYGNSSSITTAIKPLRILIAEDNYENQALMIDMLEIIGYKADLVKDGIEALDTLRKNQYDVLLIDINMPKMNGIETTKEILKRYNKDERPRIIAVTAYTLPDEIEDFYKAGIEGYISKPFVLKTLHDILAEDHKALKKVSFKLDTNNTGKEVLNPIIFDQYTKNTKEKMLASFQTTMPKSLKAVEKFVREQRFVDIIQECKAVKGVALNFGASLLVTSLEQLSAKAASEDSMLTTQFIDKLSEDYQTTLIELTKLL